MPQIKTAIQQVPSICQPASQSVSRVAHEKANYMLRLTSLSVLIFTDGRFFAAGEAATAKLFNARSLVAVGEQFLVKCFEVRTKYCLGANLRLNVRARVAAAMSSSSQLSIAVQHAGSKSVWLAQISLKPAYRDGEMHTISCWILFMFDNHASKIQMATTVCMCVLHQKAGR